MSETSLILLDTNAVIDHVPVPDGFWGGVSILTMIELQSGLNAASAARERARRHTIYRHVMDTYDPLPVDRAVLAAYGDIDYAVRQANRQPRRRLVDLLIAATARAHGVPLLTSNTDDFAGLDGIVDVRHP